MTLPPQQQTQRHRHSTCHRHPYKPITGFCASCLRERLAGIDPDSHRETPINHLADELCRSKSYSSTSNINASFSTAGATTVAEPRRKSCDVRAPNTLADLFLLDDKRRTGSNPKPKALDLRLEVKEEEENAVDIGVSKDVIPQSGSIVIKENVEIFEENGEFKTMMEFIDLEWERNRNAGGDFKGIAGSFWEAASVFRKKLVKWQRAQKKKIKMKHGVGGGHGDLIGRERFNVGKKPRETQSEMGEYGFGRRSCDTDPRLSVDFARISIDDPMQYFDEPRASWDGYMIGKTHPRLTPLISVVEDVKLSGDESDNLKDNRNLKNAVRSSPGGTRQTRGYCSDRRQLSSFDKSGLNRTVELVEDELKSLSNAKVSPETVGLFHGAKLLATERELRDSNWYSPKGYAAETFVDSLPRDVGSGVGSSNKRGFKFKGSHSWRSLRNIWDLMHGRSENKSGDEESSIDGNAVDTSMVESSNKLSEGASEKSNEVVSQKLLRSYTLSARDSPKMASSTCDIEAKDNGMKRREDMVLQRNPSTRQSPNNIDNALLRFYLTPVRSYGRSKSRKTRQVNHFVGTNVF